MASVVTTWRLQLTVFNRTVIKKEEKLERKEEKRPEDIKKEKDQDELTPGAASRSRVTKSGTLDTDGRDVDVMDRRQQQARRVT